MSNLGSQEIILLGLIAVFIAMVVFFVLTLKRIGRAQEGAPGSEAALRKELADCETRLQEALSRADRAETLASARAETIEKLQTDLSSERAQSAQGGEALRNALADAARANAEAVAKAKATEQAEAATKDANKLIAELRLKIEQEQKAQRDLNAEVASLNAKIKAEREQSEEKLSLLSEVREGMQERFRVLAEEALRTQGEAFSRANVEKLEATLTPLKEHVGHFEKELREVHQETVKDRERLKAEILQLSQRSEAISQEAVALTRALKGDRQKQGAWGEMILETILQRSGLRDGEEYETQANRQGVEGERLRPDVVIHIPGGKSLVVDSKVSLNDYAASLNAESEDEASIYRRAHVAAMRDHINRLSAKGYQLAEGRSVDYVIMFVPIEGALSEALREDGKLTEYALDKNITIATPTTLMMALRTVAHVWSVERRNKNAEDIAKRAGLLYDKVAGFVASMEKVGKGIDSANRAYDDALGQLSRGRGNVLSQVEMLKSLGGRASKSIAVDFEGKAQALQISAEQTALEAIGED